MISKASKEIKTQAKKRKEQQDQDYDASTNSQGFTLDGKPEKFPFKNIKPKKAFLLGGGGASQSDTDEDDTNNTTSS